MHTLFLLNPTAGKADCTRTLPEQIHAAAARAGLPPQDYALTVTTHAGHARELAHAAAEQTRQAGETLRIFTAGGDGTFNEKMPPWAVCPTAAATIFCVPSGQKKSFWTWTPSWPAGKYPSI